MIEPWDYLIVSASSELQADSYRKQLALRINLNLVEGFRKVLVVADPGGRRIGSGGSTVYSILRVLSRCLTEEARGSFESSACLEALHSLRILILHAGGDSTRLPTYGPCGKLFVPLPGDSDRPFSMTIFDRQLPIYRALPAPVSGSGQVVITSGDVLLDFDPTAVRFASEGLTGLGCYALPEEASHHGVFCSQDENRVELFLQKPSVQEQEDLSAIGRHGQTIMDIGVMNLCPQAVTSLLELFETELNAKGELDWKGHFAETVLESGLDFYREICCAMGSSASASHHASASSRSGSRLTEQDLGSLFRTVSKIPFSVQVLPRCHFLHFGTLGQLISSGSELLSRDYGVSQYGKYLSINNVFEKKGEIVGSRAWVEGSSINARLSLGGENVVVGLDLTEPLALPEEACLDLLPGKSREGQPVFFVRCYGSKDSFGKGSPADLQFCGQTLQRWLGALGASPESVWVDDPGGGLWTARLFPAVGSASFFKNFVWMFDPSTANDQQKKAWREADRYSHQEIAELADRDKFHSRRRRFRSKEIRGSFQKIFRPKGEMSAAELAYLFSGLAAGESASWISEILRTAFDQFGSETRSYGVERLELSRILHTLGSALLRLIENRPEIDQDLKRLVKESLDSSETGWLESLGIGLSEAKDVATWATLLQDTAFENLSQTIVLGSREKAEPPASVLRSDEIVWGRAPARLDLGGGWTDTPPYSLEHGGCVINAAVNLNGQPPIQVYARIIGEPVIRVTSIDHGARAVIETLEQLLDYRKATGQFALAKAALVLSGFSPETARWPSEVNTLEEMLVSFGGGIELTTLAAIPSGSGLGTSSIMGAVLTAVINRLLGIRLTERELFNRVLQLEQELTTGGGWQDQIGGAVGGVKLISTEAGLVPDPRIHFVPADLLSPRLNGGQTLLYYTGIRRLAKNILRGVVGNYLDRDRVMMSTLRDLHSLPPGVAESLSRKEMERFGYNIDVAWRLNQQIDPDSTTEVIDEILDQVAPYILGAKLLGAGGGGFLLMITRSIADAQSVRTLLIQDPPNERARFFEYEISEEGLAVTVC